MLAYVIAGEAAASLKDTLESSGIATRVFWEGAQGILAVQRFLPDVLILDRQLHDLDCFDVLAWIRRNYGDIPVIIVAPTAMECDIHKAFEAGVDDYVSNRMSDVELVARIKGLVSRYRRVSSELRVIEIGPYTINCMEQAVYVSGNRIKLSPKEYDILEVLARNIGRVVPRDTILTRVWGRSNEPAASRTLDTHIYRMRRRLNLTVSSGVLLNVHYNQGYRLEYLPKAIAIAA